MARAARARGPRQFARPQKFGESDGFSAVHAGATPSLGVPRHGLPETASPCLARVSSERGLPPAAAAQRLDNGFESRWGYIEELANAGTCLRYLGAPTPNLEETRHYLGLIARDGKRAAEVVSRIRGLVKKMPPRRDLVDMNDAIREVIALSHNEMQRSSVTLRTRLSSGLLLVPADRIQLQQVILNLVVNAIEAMNDVGDRPHELTVSSGRESNDVFVEVRDSGPGVDPANLDRLFKSFFTTKPEGMGMGLSISRSIIEAHGGRLSATPNEPHGVVFRFTVPTEALPAPPTRPGARLTNTESVDE